MLLVIDCCLRGDDSATRAYYQAYLRFTGEQDIQIVELDKLGLMPLDGKALRERDSLIRAQDFGREQFLLARQFREADELLVAAPFWDLSFPSLLKVYLEQVTVNGLTFGYDEQGVVAASAGQGSSFIFRLAADFMVSATCAMNI